MAGTPRIALIGEARGEFLFLRSVADRVVERCGPASAIQIELDSTDISSDELRDTNTLVPMREAQFAAALAIPARDVPARITQAETEFGIPNLRRLWLQDILRWRDGTDELELARQALGYIAVFDRLFRDHPELVGGFAEESARMIKRIFRAVARHHGREMLISIIVPTGQVVFVDQEDYDVGLSPAWTDFDPTAAELDDARSYLAQVRSGSVPFGAMRDLSVSVRRIARFGRLVARSVRPREAGDRNLHPLFFARDFTQQRLRVAQMAHATEKNPHGRGVIYPLHASFDSQLTIRGEPFRNQVALSELIAESLPFGYDLWLKPHPYAADIPFRRLAEVQRRLSNVRLIHPSVPLRTLLDRASALVTVNSTAGFEALIARVPVVTLGISHYRGRGLTTDVVSPYELPAALRNATHSEAPTIDEIARLVAWFRRIGYDMPYMGADLSPANARRFADALIDRFEIRTLNPA
jgi:hypothetical protein